jgi:uncharacterized protein DUF5076
MDEQPIPAAAQRDKNSREMLRVWIAEHGLHCSIRVGMYHQSIEVAEGRAWGLILADVTRHLAAAMENRYQADQGDVIQEIFDNYVKELKKPTAVVKGDFVKGDRNADKG